MAVVQISRIQVRRGRSKTGTGFPQLASGELGWAIDTQELYIGNGAVSEGSPAVGNTKILTENDLIAQGNLLNLLEHVYKANDSNIVTGPDANHPASRSVQDRLDDRVTLWDFVLQEDIDSSDYTISLQRAINQLFLNPNTKASANTSDGVKSRVTLELPAGEFNFTSPLFIPSYATIVGAGDEKTKLIFTPTATFVGAIIDGDNTVLTTFASTNMIGSTISGTGIPLGTIVTAAVNKVSLTLSNDATATNATVSLQSSTASPAIRFVNDSSNLGSPSSLSSTLGTTQPKFITLKDLSLVVAGNSTIGLELDCVKHSIFENLYIFGSAWSYLVSGSKGIKLEAISNIVTSEYNIFRNVRINGFDDCVYSDKDISNNLFDHCTFTNAIRGVSFGNATQFVTSVGKQYGPCDNTIVNCVFSDIRQQAVYIEKGTGNTVSDVKLTYIGNDGGDDTSITYPQIYFGQYGNFSRGIRSDRTKRLGLSEYVVRKVTLTLSANITADRGAIVSQAVSGATGTLVEDAIETNVITLFVSNTFITFNNSNNLTIAGDSTPSNTNTAVHPTVVGSFDVTPYINYIPEVAGYGTFSTYDSLQLILSQQTVYSPLCKLPVSTDKFGDGLRSIFYVINYHYRSINNFVRRGTLQVCANIDDGTIHLTDEYDYVGSDDDSLTMEFRAKLLDENGDHWSLGAIRGIGIEYINTLTDNGGLFEYSYISNF